MKKTPGDIIIFHKSTIKWQSYDAWFLRYEVWLTKCLVNLDRFLPLNPLNNPKNQNFEKLEKTSADIIIFHMCTKNYDQMLYSFWDTVRDRCNCYLFRAIFCPFIPLTAPKIKILKKWKKSLEISSFYISVSKIMTRWLRFLRNGVWRIKLFFILGHFLPFYPLTAQKIKILEKWKKQLEIWSDGVRFLRYGTW